MELLLVPLVSAVAGYLAGRSWVTGLAVTACLGATVFLVTNNGWYGHGWGDSGITLNVLVNCLTIASASIGVAVRRA